MKSLFAVGVTVLLCPAFMSGCVPEPVEQATESVYTVPQIPPSSGPFFVFRNDRMYGVINGNGDVLVDAFFFAPRAYATRSRTSDRKLVGQESTILRDYERWVLLDESGSKVIPSPYPHVGHILNLGDSLFSINVLGGRIIKDQWGRIPVNYDLKDRWNPPEGVVARGRVSEGKVAISLNGKLGYADRDGNVIVQPQFEHAEPFYEDRAAVCKQGRWGYINPDGKLVILLQYRGCSWFDSGVAIVKPYDQSETFLIDKDGKKLRDFPLSRIVPDGAFNGFEDGLFRKSLDTPMETYGFINTEGEWVIEGWGLNGPTSAATFVNGPAIVARRLYRIDPNTGNLMSGPGKYSQGKYLLYRDGTLGPRITHGVQWNPFRYGLAGCRDTGAYIDEQGKVVWKPPGMTIYGAMENRGRRSWPYEARHNQLNQGKPYLNGKPVVEEGSSEAATEKTEE